MCGTPSIGDVVRGATDVMTFGTAEIGGVSKKLGNVANTVLGGKSGSYTPQLLPNTDPTMQLAQSGGAPLLTSVALGASVDDAVAGYFGRSSGSDFNAWYATLSGDQQAAINGVKTQLKQIQSNTDLRNQAVQKVVNDFPNIVSMTAPKVIAAKQQAGEEFDAATKGYLDYAMRSVAAKAGGTGTVSSGATIQAAADEAAKLGLDKLAYTQQAGDTAFNRNANDLLGSWEAQYTEANALRSFQQKMLGQGADQGFSANQTALQRQQQTGLYNTDVINQKNASDQAANNQLFGSLGTLAGTGAIYGLMSPSSANAAGPSQGAGPSGVNIGYQPGIGPTSAPTNSNQYAPSGGYR